MKFNGEPPSNVSAVVYFDISPISRGTESLRVTRRALAIVNPFARLECTVRASSLLRRARNSYVARGRKKDYELRMRIIILYREIHGIS